MPESLEMLLKAAKKEAWETKQRQPSRPKLDTCQEDRWTPGELIELRHESGEALGVFRELNYVTGGRRLVKAQGTPVRTEIVAGEHWLHAKRDAPKINMADDEHVIRQRFYELMDTFNEEAENDE